MAASTNVIYQIGIHATAETAIPTVPNKYSNMTMTGYTVIGSIARGDSADLDEATVTNPFDREKTIIKPPLSLAISDAIVNTSGAGEFSFTCYDGNETLLTLDSNLTVTSHVGEFTTTTTKRAVIIEVNGLWVDYFPNCLVHVTQSVAGVKAATTTQFTVTPIGTTTVKGGWQRKWFQPA